MYLKSLYAKLLEAPEGSLLTFKIQIIELGHRLCLKGACKKSKDINVHVSFF